MKKKYICPEMMIVVAETASQLLSASYPTGSSVYNDSADTENTVLSRHNSVWDDVDEDEDFEY